jgi:hypothetical protein
MSCFWHSQLYLASIFRRRRDQPRRPAVAKIKPGLLCLKQKRADPWRAGTLDATCAVLRFSIPTAQTVLVRYIIPSQLGASPCKLAQDVTVLRKSVAGVLEDCRALKSLSLYPLNSPSMCHWRQSFCFVLSVPIQLSKRPCRARESVWTRRSSPAIIGGADGCAPANP